MYSYPHNNTLKFFWLSLTENAYQWYHEWSPIEQGFKGHVGNVHGEFTDDRLKQVGVRPQHADYRIITDNYQKKKPRCR